MSSTAVRCDFCYRRCRIPEGGKGYCGVREQVNGQLRTRGYAQVLTAAVDPIEKKPLYHFMPGAKTLSIALFGCNFHCQYCQNYEMSQPDGFYAPDQQQALSMSPVPEVSPEELVGLMKAKGLKIMSYTYSDPIVWQDYMLRTAELVHEAGGLNCMITNGSFTPESLERVLPHIDAFNIDLKGDAAFYQDICSGALEPVMASIERIARDPDTVLEVTTMIIEGFHSLEYIQTAGQALADCGVQVWHLSRFFPHYHMADRAPTSEAYLSEMLSAAAASPVPHIYAGNSVNLRYEATACPSCGRRLINSHGYRGEARFDVTRNLKGGRCAACGQPVYGRFSL